MRALHEEIFECLSLAPIGNDWPIVCWFLGVQKKLKSQRL